MSVPCNSIQPDVGIFDACQARVGIAQLVQCPTEKPGSSPLVRQGILLPESTFTFSALSYGVCGISCTARAIACIVLSACKKSKPLAAIPLFGHKNMLHTLTEMGGASSAAAVLYPGKATQTSGNVH